MSGLHSVLDQNLQEIVIRTLLAIKLWLTHTRADLLKASSVAALLCSIKLVLKWKYRQGLIQDFSYVSQSFPMYNLVLRAAKARGT
jgi:hypothetical protein